MLTHSFTHLGKLGRKLERQKNSRGLITWEDVLSWEPEKGDKFAAALKDAAALSAANLSLRDFGFFSKELPSNETWKLFPYFREKVCYLDIETTGMSKQYDYTTVATIYDGENVMVFTHGQNMSDLPAVLERYSICVTYNGKCFDVPFLEREFNCHFNLVHIDLMYVFRRLGYKGGLKKLEKVFGINRGEWADLNGYAAVLLWQWHLRGTKGALDTLTAYNILDAVNLEKLMCLAYNLEAKTEGFPELGCLDEPSLPEIPFNPDEQIIARAIRQSAF